ncbi:MAG: glycosyltransferase family 39 protein [Anaerolineales bacterium]|nr:glycosyltransferase family 39 protein [Anaerolineales bacterium]
MRSAILSARWWLWASLVLVFFAVRWPGLGRYVTIDEVFWLTQSAKLAVAVEQGDWHETGLAGHPGLTTAWAGVLGLRARLPDFASDPPEQITDFHVRNAFRQAGYNPVQILAAARQVMVLANTLVFAALAWYLLRVWGGWPAALAGGLLALDPFLIAHQRLLHQDGLMAGLVLLALLAFAWHQRTGQLRHAAVAGLAAGLAWLTKSPTLLLGPCILALAVWQAWRQPAARRTVWRGVLVCGLAALLVYVALWPKMWVAPLEALGEVWSYAAETASGEHSGPIFFNGQLYPNGELGLASAYFYLYTFLWRATPLDWLGVLAAAAALWAWRRQPPEQRQGLAALLGFAAVFILAMSVAAKKFDRYMLPAYAALVLLAGWGLAAALRQWRGARWRPLAAAALLLGAQAFWALGAFPYYLNFYNPLLGGTAAAQHVMLLGWGEGLDEAASFLSRQPDVGTARVAAWYSNAFSFQSPLAVDDIPIAAQLSSAELQATLAHDYLVIYVHQWQRHTPQNLLDALADLQPVYTLVLDGVDYVRVYQP